MTLRLSGLIGNEQYVPMSNFMSQICQPIESKAKRKKRFTNL